AFQRVDGPAGDPLSVATIEVVRTGILLRKSPLIRAHVQAAGSRVTPTLRSPNIRSVLVISIGSGPTPRSMETPPGRRPLKVAAIVLPPDAVIGMTLAPPSACRATAGSVAALSM